ncbi:MAG: PG0541 family transporter-associated protein [Bradymonadaceae bacterium]
MKSIMIVYNQILDEELLDLLDSLSIRGFTRWNDVQGRGTRTGDPHMGTHTWPSLNGAMICVVEDDQVEGLLEAIKDMDADERGLRAFVWHVEEAI